MDKIIIIIGPTASGKTALSIELAKQLNGEIINGDSMQVYRTLDIGTAKITIEEMAGIPHHLIDICDVSAPFTASDFKEHAISAINEITKRGRVPIIVGGTGLYIEGLLFDFHYSGEGSNHSEYRDELEKQLSQYGPQFLWKQLAQKDVVASKLIHPNNSRRVIRALEVIHTTGRLFSDFDHQQKIPRYDAYIIATNLERADLYNRINHRVDIMIEKGLENEARVLFEEYGDQDIQALRGIGYKEWFPYFRDEQSLEITVETIKQNSRRYAKRQLTWFRNRISVTQWVDTGSFYEVSSEVLNDCQQFLIQSP